MWLGKFNRFLRAVPHIHLRQEKAVGPTKRGNHKRSLVNWTESFKASGKNDKWWNIDVFALLLRRRCFSCWAGCARCCVQMTSPRCRCLWRTTWHTVHHAMEWELINRHRGVFHLIWGCLEIPWSKGLLLLFFFFYQLYLRIFIPEG